jgi:hypothetical protein
VFEYERILEVASGTGSEGGVQALSRSIDRASTAVVKTLATNAFYACGAMVNATLFSPAVYTFRCSDSAFSHLQDTINGTCTNGLNASVGAAYYHCYAGGAYLSWSAVDAFGHAVNLTASGTLASLNTPKGASHAQRTRSRAGAQSRRPTPCIAIAPSVHAAAPRRASKGCKLRSTAQGTCGRAW